jgi:hypothetical protein
VVGGGADGFHVERRDGGASEYVRLTAQEIRAEPPSRFEDFGVAEESSYEYRVIAIDGELERSFGPVSVITGRWPAFETRLDSVGPNPAVGRASISFTLGAPSHAKLTIFDVAGRRVRTLVDGALDAGPHRLDWEGVDASGQRIPAGVYFARLEAPSFTQTRKILYIRGR